MLPRGTCPSATKCYGLTFSPAINPEHSQRSHPQAAVAPAPGAPSPRRNLPDSDTGRLRSRCHSDQEFVNHLGNLPRVGKLLLTA